MFKRMLSTHRRARLFLCAVAICLTASLFLVPVAWAWYG